MNVNDCKKPLEDLTRARPPAGKRGDCDFVYTLE